MKKSFIKFGVRLCFLTVMMAGASAAQEASPNPIGALVPAYTKFGFELFAQAVKQDAGKNVFISPSSVAFALAMTYNGTAGTTREAMAKTLGLEGLDLEAVNQGNAVLRDVLENPDPEVELEIANSLWAREGVTFKPEFLKANRKFYEAEVTVLDFRDPGAPSIINGWVNQKTKGKIDQIVERIEPLSILFLINAIYFKGKWAAPFDKALTRERPFTLLDGSQKSHPMMSQSGRYPYYRGDKFQAVSLPYGEGRVSMYVFLPDKESGLEELYAGLNRQNWEDWISRFEETGGDIVLPRFTLEYGVTLNDILKSLGMEIAFDRGRANFERMCPTAPNVNVYIDEVKHKTFVEVNEEGTEAAAVTSVVVGVTAMPAGERFTMIVDRPFFLAIRDNKTGTVLFLGSIVDPT